MKLLDHLKQLKLIEPDESFSRASKRAILATPGVTPKSFTFRQFLLRGLETAVVAGLGALFIILIGGGFSGSASPLPFAAINPKTLNAEAQAINIQIQLSKVSYEEPSSTPVAESTVVTASGTQASPVVLIAPSSTASASETASTTPSSTVSIDDALQALSQ